MQSSEFEKVPTLLAYGNQNPPKCKWGFEVTSDVLNPLSWFKLLLNGSLPPRKDASITATTSRQLSRIISPEPENCYQELQATIAAIPKGMKPVDIVTDFLRAINQHTNKFLNKTYPKSFTKLIGVEIPVKYCLTVPAVSSQMPF